MLRMLNLGLEKLTIESWDCNTHLLDTVLVWTELNLKQNVTKMFRRQECVLMASVIKHCSIIYNWIMLLLLSNVTDDSWLLLIDNGSNKSSAKASYFVKCFLKHLCPWMESGNGFKLGFQKFTFLYFLVTRIASI